MQDKQYLAVVGDPMKLSLLHQSVVYLRVSRELDTASIALVLRITPDEVERLENEARRYLQAATERGEIPITSSAHNFKN